MIVLAIVAYVFLLVRLGVVLSNLIQRQWLGDQSPEEFPLVSVLIPARNEENNLGTLMQSILRQDYPKMEIIVYDDDSLDATAAIVQSYLQRDPRIRLIKGNPLPDGWLGKNHACHQLTQKASGDYFLFLDADVEIGEGLIKNALRHMMDNRLQLFSIFPQQIMRSWGEWVTVPVMNHILLSLLPLSLIKTDRRASLSAANGQFMLFDSAVYRDHWFHQVMKDQIVEDIRIMKYMKSMGFRVHTLLSNGQIKCRMYNGFQEAITGFSRNVIDYFGGYVLAMILYIIFAVFGFIFVYTGLPLWLFAAYLVINLIMTVLISVISRQSVMLNILLMPVHGATFLWMGFKGIKSRITGTWNWKDRQISGL